jgi:hypothetical protein
MSYKSEGCSLVRAEEEMFVTCLLSEPLFTGRGSGVFHPYKEASGIFLKSCEKKKMKNLNFEFLLP